MFRAWEHWVWIKPVTRQFVTDLELGTGTLLVQEVAGVQERVESLHGANHAEYAEVVEAAGETEYIEGFSQSAEPVFGHGYECFRVEIHGTKKVKPGQASDRTGSYTYDPANAAVG
jgi:hypothetical protein